MVAGTPKHGIISCNNTLVISRALAVLVGTASGQPKKVSVNTNKYQYPLFLEVQKSQSAIVVQAHVLSRFGPILVWGCFWGWSGGRGHIVGLLV